MREAVRPLNIHLKPVSMLVPPPSEARGAPACVVRCSRPVVSQGVRVMGLAIGRARTPLPSSPLPPRPPAPRRAGCPRWAVVVRRAPWGLSLASALRGARRLSLSHLRHPDRPRKTLYSSPCPACGPCSVPSALKPSFGALVGSRRSGFLTTPLRSIKTKTKTSSSSQDGKRDAHSPIAPKKPPLRGAD